MTRLSLVTVVLCALASGACKPNPPEVPAHGPVLRVASADSQAAWRMTDNIYRYSGFRPDTITLRADTLLVHMPPGALGQRLRLLATGCDVGEAPHGIIQTVARHAFRTFGSTRGVSMVVVTIPGMTVERTSMFEHGSLVNSVSCSLGGSVSQFNARELQPCPSEKRT